MDRSLDDTINSRQNNNRSRSRRGNFPRDGVRKSSQRDSPRNLDQDWVHDRYDDDDSRNSFRSVPQGPRASQQAAEGGHKVKVENLHYEISEDDLKELFSRIGRVRTATLVYDRQDRSRGIGYVTYYNSSDALAAMDSYNGQKAYGQTIYLTLVPASNPGRPADMAGRNPPSRSLFDRIERPLERRITDDRDRSSSPRRARHSDVSRPAPENIDRYVPGAGRNDRRRSPPARRGGGAERGGRRPGQTREQSGRREGGARSGARPRKTQEELDAEMADYFEKPKEAVPAAAAAAAAPANGTAAAAAAAPATDDIDMIE